MIYIILLISWISFGAAGFIYWWTKDNDFTTSEMSLMIFSSFFGPFSWLMGWWVHGGKEPKIIIKKRK